MPPSTYKPGGAPRSMVPRQSYKQLGGQRRTDTEPPVVQLDAGDDSQAHNSGIITEENIAKLAQYADHWCIILHFEKDQLSPTMHMFPAETLPSLFQQNKLCGVTMMCGLKTSHRPKIPIPAHYFRTLEYILQLIVAGNNYKPITDKELAKGGPPASWCRVPVVSTAEDAVQAHAVHLAPNGSLDPSALFRQAASWCYVYAYHCSAESIRCAMGIEPDQMLREYKAQELSEYTLVVGMVDNKPKNVWVPPCVLVPLGALLYVMKSGRAYIPLQMQELREARKAGITTLFNRNVKPILLEQALAANAQPTSIPGDIPGAEPVSPRRTQPSRKPSAAAPPSPTATTENENQASTSQTGSPTAPAPATDTLPSGNFVMPLPFDMKPSTPPPEIEAVISPFLGAYNFGCRTTFETSAFKLFLGDKSQTAFASNWWYIDTQNQVKGPYSSEQMMLDYLSQYELHDEVLICGTVADPHTPLTPPMKCFMKLGELFKAMDAGGSYVLVTKQEVFAQANPVAAMYNLQPVNRIKYYTETSATSNELVSTTNTAATSTVSTAPSGTRATTTAPTTAGLAAAPAPAAATAPTAAAATPPATATAHLATTAATAPKPAAASAMPAPLPAAPMPAPSQPFFAGPYPPYGQQLQPSGYSHLHAGPYSFPPEASADPVTVSQAKAAAAAAAATAAAVTQTMRPAPSGAGLYTMPGPVGYIPTPSFQLPGRR